MRPNSRVPRLLQLLETLTLAAVGGAALGLSGFPAGWLCGSMLVVAVAALLGRPVGLPSLLRSVVFIVIGISLGTVVTPETLQSVANWPLSMLVLALATLGATAATMIYLRLVHGWDAYSAFFAATPGALSQTVLMATHVDADVRGVAIVQTVRVLILTIGTPAALTMLGQVGTPVFPTGRATINPVMELSILIIASVAGGLLLDRLRMRAGMMFGAMLVSAVLHGTGLIQIGLPWWIAAAAMVGLGAMTGSRFAGLGWRILLRYLAAALGSFVVVCVVTAAFALALIALSPLRPGDVTVAFAPGALETMMILALTLHLDPLYVGAHHLARFILVSVSLPMGAHLLARLGFAPPVAADKIAKVTPPRSPD